MDVGGISGGAGPQRGIGAQSAGPGPLIVGKGDVLKALVVEVLGDDKAVLQIAGRTITANTAFSLSGLEGKMVLLKSLGSGSQAGELVLKLAGDASLAEEISGQIASLTEEVQSSLDSGGAPDALFGKLANLLMDVFTKGAQLTPGERSALGGMLLRMLDSGGQKNAFTERLFALLSASNTSPDGASANETDGQKLLRALANFFPDMAQGSLEEAALKKALMQSGVLFESKMLSKLNFSGDDPKTKTLSKELKDISSQDLKALLLKLKTASGSDEQAGTKKLIDGLLKDLRAFQFISKLTGSLYSFLPVKWDGLKEGRIAFKADEHEGGSCLINLDLEGLGKIAVSVFMRTGEFYVTLKVQNPSFRDAVNGAAGDALKAAFSEKGLSLRTVNVTHYDESPKNHLEFPGDYLIDIKL